MAAKKKQYITRHDSIFAYMDYLRPDRKGGVSTATAADDRHYNGEWNGTKDWRTAEKYAREGWPEGRERVTELTDGLIDALAGRITREEWTPDLIGNHVDLGAYLAGEPDCWRRIELVEDPHGVAFRHVSILYNASVSCGVQGDVIEARGAAVAALVDLLELSGFSTTVTVVFAGSDRDEDRGISVADYIRIKPPSERADLASLMFWLANPAAFRRIGFAGYETRSAEIRAKLGARRGGFYSQPCDPDLTEDNPDIYIGAGYIGTPAGRGRWTDLAATKQWLSETLKTLGVSLKD